MTKIIGSILFSIFVIYCSVAQINKTKVLTGLDNISNFTQIFENKKVGIVTNHTAYNTNDEHIVDVFLKMEKVKVEALFGPEHGIRGKEVAGDKIDDSIDQRNKIPIYSLYGKTKKPSPEMIKNCDVLVFDIQDVGARFYTYISTMALAMEASAEKGIKFVVFDRPNPINGIDVEGNILEPEFKTFVGMFPIPVRHGMTMAELAKMINEEGWLKNGIKADLTIIPMSGWKREMWYDETNLKWRPPSPNIPNIEVATVYPGTCLFEGTNVSEGRGTLLPFLKLGASWFSKENYSDVNTSLDIPGANIKSTSFMPVSIPTMSLKPKFMNQKIYGIEISLTDRKLYKPYLTGIELVKYFYDLKKDKFEWREKHFDRLCGTAKIREMIIAGVTVEKINQWLNTNLSTFQKIRLKYLIY